MRRLSAPRARKVVAAVGGLGPYAVIAAIYMVTAFGATLGAASMIRGRAQP